MEVIDNAKRKHDETKGAYFGIGMVPGLEPEPEIKRLWETRHVHTKPATIARDLRVAYESSGRSDQTKFVLGLFLKQFLISPREGEKLLLQVADKAKFAPAALEMGQIRFRQGDYAAAKRYWEVASQAKIGEGTCALARLYRDGMGVPQNVDRAIELYRKSAFEEGYYEAFNNLAASLINRGRTQPFYLENMEECRNALERGVELDHPGAFVNFYSFLRIPPLLSGLDIRAMTDLMEPSKADLKRADALLQMAIARNEPRSLTLWQQRNGEVQKLPICGEQLSSDGPLSSKLYCSTCLVKENDSVKLRKCSRCHEAMYCCELCQKTDWKARHKHTCQKVTTGA